MKRELWKYGVWIVVVILVVGLLGIIILATFDIFPASDKKILSYQCDHEGLRLAEIYRLDGNAVTSASIHVSVYLGCDTNERKSETEIFTVDNFGSDNDVTINWISFDTLAIEYKQGLRTFTRLDNVAYPDSTLNLHVTYKELD